MFNSVKGIYLEHDKHIGLNEWINKVKDSSSPIIFVAHNLIKQRNIVKYLRNPNTFCCVSLTRTEEKQQPKVGN